MGNGNYIKLNRSIQEWGWYSDPITKAVFIELLLRARYHDCEKSGVKLEIGDASFGRKELAKVLGISEQNVRTAVKHLIKTGEISTKKVTNRFSVVSITNWAKYQDGDDSDNQQANQDLTNDQPTVNQQLTTNKERKNVRKEESKEICSREMLEIVSYLNEKVGTRYSPKTRKTQDMIRARMNDGFTVDDFKVVIDKKADEWLGDPKMEKYLRPETLFSNKFEGYLNQPWVRKSSGNPFVDMMYEEIYDQDRDSAYSSNTGILLPKCQG